MTKKYWWALGGLVVILLLAGYWQSKQSKLRPTNEAIQIGAILSETGSAATDGLNIRRGLELAQEDLAKQGVIVDIQYQDDATEPQKAVSSLQYLLATQKPQAIIGPTWSFLEDSVAPVIAQSKVVIYAPADTSEFVTVLSPYQFHGAPRNALKEKPVANWLKDNGKKRVAVIVDKTGWGESNASAFKAAAADAGAEVVVDEVIPPFSSDVSTTVSTILAKVKNANADVILWTGYEPDGTALVQKRQSLELNIPILAASSVYSSLISRRVVSVEQIRNVYSIEAPPSPEFVTKFSAKYGEAPGTYADRAYDGLIAITEAIQHVNSTNADNIAAYLRNDLRYEGYAGVYEFNKDGDLKGGEWVIQPVTE